MPKPRAPHPPPLLMNGYAAAVNGGRRLVNSRSSGAIPCSNVAIPLSQVTPLRRYSAAASNGSEFPGGDKHTFYHQLQSRPFPPQHTFAFDNFHENSQEPAAFNSIPPTPTPVPSGSQYPDFQRPCFRPGMREVPSWLKALRLHKYTALFQQMSYEEMMAMDDQQLEVKQVTKGARKKILQSLQKLRERVSLLRQLETCIDENGDTRCLIFELRAMMNTPIWCEVADVSQQVSLPWHICRVVDRLFSHLFCFADPSHLMSQELNNLEDEYVLKLMQTYDKIINHEAFGPSQKQAMVQQRRTLRRYAEDRHIQTQRSCANRLGTSTIHQARPHWQQQPVNGLPLCTSSSEHHQHNHSLFPSQNTFSQRPPSLSDFQANSSRFAVLEAVDSSLSTHEPAGYVQRHKQQQQQQQPPSYFVRQPSNGMIHPMNPPLPPYTKPAAYRANSFENGFKAEGTGVASSQVNSKQWFEESKMTTTSTNVPQTNKPQSPNPISYPQMLLNMLSSMPEFCQMLEKSMASNFPSRASFQTAATQTKPVAQEPLGVYNVGKQPQTTYDRPLTNEEKLEFVNECLLHKEQGKQKENEVWWSHQPEAKPDKEGDELAKQIASLALTAHQPYLQMDNAQSSSNSASFDTIFDPWFPLANANKYGQSNGIQMAAKKIDASHQPEPTRPSCLSSGYSSSNCSEPDRSPGCASPGLMVYNFNNFDSAKLSPTPPAQTKWSNSYAPSINYNNVTAESLSKADNLYAFKEEKLNRAWINKEYGCVVNADYSLPPPQLPVQPNYTECPLNWSQMSGGKANWPQGTEYHVQRTSPLPTASNHIYESQFWTGAVH